MVEQQDQDLEEARIQNERILATPIPERKLGFGVTAEYQQQFEQAKQQAQANLQFIEEERERRKQQAAADINFFAEQAAAGDASALINLRERGVDVNSPLYQQAAKARVNVIFERSDMLAQIEARQAAAQRAAEIAKGTAPPEGVGTGKGGGVQFTRPDGTVVELFPSSIPSGGIGFFPEGSTVPEQPISYISPVQRDEILRQQSLLPEERFVPPFVARTTQSLKPKIPTPSVTKRIIVAATAPPPEAYSSVFFPRSLRKEKTIERIRFAGESLQGRSEETLAIERRTSEGLADFENVIRRLQGRVSRRSFISYEDEIQSRQQSIDQLYDSLQSDKPRAKALEQVPVELQTEDERAFFNN